jgi:hypothetical protein
VTGALALAAVALAASPVSGTIGGPVTAVKAPNFTLKSSLSPTGKAKVEVSAKTTISEQVTGTRSDLKKGVCATAFGQKDRKGVIAAMRIMLSAPVKGTCASGFGRGPVRVGPGPGNGPPPGGRFYGGSRNFGGPGGLDFANGGITAVNGSTLSIHGQRGTSSVTVSDRTEIVRRAQVGISAVKVGMCAFVRGTSPDKGVTVSAQSVDLFTAGQNGCTARIRRQ